MIRILHTADVHLDSPLKSLALRDETLRERVQAATRCAFVTLIDAALDHQVAALLIAGDLFDGAARSAKTAAFLISQLDRLKEAGIAVFYIKGNHDAVNPITGELSLPDNAHIFDGRGGHVQLQDLPVWIHGVSFSGRHAPDTLLDKFSQPEPDAINIALLHTSLSGAAGHDPYAPCTVAQLSDMGFDYWALGHVHKRAVHSQAPWIVMPGIPQGRDIGESGPKSATLLTLDAGQITIEELPTSAAEFLPLVVDICGIETDDAVRHHLRQSLRDTAEAMQSDTGLLRLTLTGATARRWQILRDRDIWRETVSDLARETDRIWLEKLVFDLSDPADQTIQPATALFELHKLIDQIRGEAAFTTSATSDLETLLTQLPAGLRARLMPDAETATELTRDLANSGSLRVLAAMRGASE